MPFVYGPSNYETISCGVTKHGDGLVNTIINKLPFELHYPGGYQFLGSGTNLEKWLARGDTGINGLDRAALKHDLAYAQNQNLDARHKAD